MKATFNFKVGINDSQVEVLLGTKEIEDIDTTLMASLLKIFADVEKKVRGQVEKFFDVPEEEPVQEPDEKAQADEPVEEQTPEEL